MSMEEFELQSSVFGMLQVCLESFLFLLALLFLFLLPLPTFFFFFFYVAVIQRNAK